jgi:crotonobetainyl-CoA:carnitine CoA-transferase CaiB-like acyl-CoA transferase
LILIYPPVIQINLAIQRLFVWISTATARVSSTPWVLSKSPRLAATPAPGLGEHNYQVLGALLGPSTSEIDDLVEQRITAEIPSPEA